MYKCVDAEGRPVPIVAVPPSDATVGPVLVCPWLAGLPEAAGLWLSILPIHDANAYLTAALEAAELRLDLYWGIFALDPSRSQEMLLRLAEARGVRGIVNLPSISLFDSRTRQTFEQLGYSLDLELNFLVMARGRGFRTAMATVTHARSDEERPTLLIRVLE